MTQELRYKALSEHERKAVDHYLTMTKEHFLEFLIPGKLDLWRDICASAIKSSDTMYQTVVGGYEAAQAKSAGRPR